jgi:DNA-binding response OmpR family regulator
MLKILIVEDEPCVQDFLVKTFSTIGYSTFTSSRVEERLGFFDVEMIK